MIPTKDYCTVLWIRQAFPADDLDVAKENPRGKAQESSQNPIGEEGASRGWDC